MARPKRVTSIVAERIGLPPPSIVRDGARVVPASRLRGFADGRPRDTIVCVSVYDEMPSTGAGLLRYARLKAGLSQSQLAERAGVPRTMVSAYERDRRQATLPTLMRLLKAAGFELRIQLAPYDDHDDVLQELEQHRTAGERQAWEGYQGARVAKDRQAVSAALRARKKTKVPG
jgi:transcriptional regulator with XRE-family HTH domain